MIYTSLRKWMLTIVLLSGTMFNCLSQTSDFQLLELHQKCGNTISPEENRAYKLFSAEGFNCAIFLLKDQSDILAVVGINDTIRLNRQQLLEMFHKVDTGQVMLASAIETVCPIDTAMEVITAAEWLDVREQQPYIPANIDTSTTPRLFIQTGLEGSMGASRFGGGVTLSAHFKSGNLFIGAGGIWAFESRQYDVPTIFSSHPQTKDIYQYRSLFASFGRSIQFSQAVFSLSVGLSWENIATMDYEVRPSANIFANEEIVEIYSDHFNGPGLLTAFQVWLFPRAAIAPGLNLQMAVTKKYTTVSFGLTLRLGRIYKRKNSR